MNDENVKVKEENITSMKEQALIKQENIFSDKKRQEGDDGKDDELEIILERPVKRRRR
jgi:hypothetical protein